jgi:hypothetical protein
LTTFVHDVAITVAEASEITLANNPVAITVTLATEWTLIRFVALTVAITFQDSWTVADTALIQNIPITVTLTSEVTFANFHTPGTVTDAIRDPRATTLITFVHDVAITVAEASEITLANNPPATAHATLVPSVAITVTYACVNIDSLAITDTTRVYEGLTFAGHNRGTTFVTACWITARRPRWQRDDRELWSLDGSSNVCGFAQNGTGRKPNSRCNCLHRIDDRTCMIHLC